MQNDLPTKQEFIARKVIEPLAVRLAGEYDIWDDWREDWDGMVEFQFGLRSCERTADIWHDLFTGIPQAVYNILDLGRPLHKYQKGVDASTVNTRSFLMEFEGLKFLTLNTARCNSLTFAAKDVLETGHDALCGFYWNGKEWSVSLYHAKHRKDLDLSKIAVKHGGGGHKGACGFAAKSLPWIPGVEQLKDAGEFLLRVVSDVSGGNWQLQSPVWQAKAVEARDQFHAVCKQLGLPVA